MSDFKDTVIVEPRRLQLLRFLVELNGEANESVILSALRRAGFAQATREDIRSDLDHLNKIGCTTQEWFGEIRVVRVTERGDDVAHGRIAAGGVQHEREWRRGS